MAVRNEADAVRKKELKGRLPVFTPSGLFRGNGASTLIRPTGLICIDIDGKDNRHVEDYGNLKQRLGKLPYVAFCGISVGGEGYYALIPIAQPDKFLRHFRSLQAEFSAMGITIDPACCDVSRKRFVSFDPEPYINQEAETYEGLADELVAFAPTLTAYGCADSTDGSVLLNEVRKYIHIIEKKEIDITVGWWAWFGIGCALHHTFGESGREMFHAVSQFHHLYNYPETDKLFNSIAKGRIDSGKPITIATFFRYARFYKVDVMVDFWDEE